MGRIQYIKNSNNGSAIALPTPQYTILSCCVMAYGVWILVHRYFYLFYFPICFVYVSELIVGISFPVSVRQQQFYYSQDKI
jgi:hypothetical protein